MIFEKISPLRSLTCVRELFCAPGEIFERKIKHTFKYSKFGWIFRKFLEKCLQKLRIRGCNFLHLIVY